MTLQKTLHILGHGTNLSSGFIAQARALAATLQGEDQLALTNALARHEAVEKPQDADKKGK
jgi:hypothetical protein